jgi:hypothetical protein
VGDHTALPRMPPCNLAEIGIPFKNNS